MKPCGIHSLGLPRRFQPLPEIEDLCLSISTQGDRKHQNDEAGVSRNCFLHKNNKLLLRRGIFFSGLQKLTEEVGQSPNNSQR